MLQGVFFDLDGVIIDTERYGHRVAFNQAFSDFGIPDAVWDEALYHQLLQIGGGKERIRYYFTHCYHGTHFPPDLDAFVKDVHRHKTDLFLQILPNLPLRPGILRIMTGLRDAGIPMGICTTSNERVARIVSQDILSQFPFSPVIAGDMVVRKKPDPEIYQKAAQHFGAAASHCLVVEDSRIGVSAAVCAGCRVIATYNQYTCDEDLSAAHCIVSCLGDPESAPVQVKKDPDGLVSDGMVQLDRIIQAFST